MTFGIPDRSITLMLEALAKYPEIERACVFGSRVMGNYKHGSDVDLVIYGPDATDAIRDRVSVALNEELPLPYFFDVVRYEAIQNPALKKHIDSEGREFYRRGSLS